ncbi:MAG: DUF5107 domain-containing protein [Armatimonadetes bacterium]|nr:DUF5107 domain-containing protein [Armatimonadota bacterium]
MPSTVFEDRMDVAVRTVEPVAFDLGGPGFAAYPYHRLDLTGRIEQGSLEIVVLENQYLRVTVCPGLGGRIICLHDRRTGIDVIPQPGEIVPTPGGPRGLELPHGLLFFADRPDPAGGMDRVDHVVHEPEGDGPAAVLLHGLVLGTGLSWQVCLTLPPDEAAVLVELRAHNRTLLPEPYSCGCSISYDGDSSLSASGPAVYSRELDAGLAFCGKFEAWRCRDGRAVAHCVLNGVLAPREAVEHRWRIVPVSGLGGLTGAGAEVCAHVADGELRLQSSSRLAGHKVFLLTDDGQTVETDADLYPEHVFSADLSGLACPAVAVSVRDPKRRALLEFRLDGGTPAPLAATESEVGASMLRARDAALNAPNGPGSLEEAMYGEAKLLHAGGTDQMVDPASLPINLRGPGHLLQAAREARAGDFREAGESLEHALSTLADDHLVWWQLAVVKRLSGEAGEDRPELLNAHFLSPLEPALRGEAFLAMDQAMGKEPSPVLERLTADPDGLHEAVHLLVESGLFGEAARLADEAFRHGPQPLLRYLIAWCLLQGTRMDVEAGEHVRRAAESSIGPPYPWRRLECVAVTELASRFPDDDRLCTLAKMVGAFRQRATAPLENGAG